MARRATHPRIRSAAFTLTELVVVVGIIALVTGMVAFLPQGDKRAAAVRSAGEELATTLRRARAIAMDRRVVCGVAFNIENGAGTSGRVLNNWGGGHWYRIVGDAPIFDDETALSSYPVPTFTDQDAGGSGNVSQFLGQVRSAWIDEPHVLAPHKVRLLALGDQDNGSGGWTASGKIPATYPRPWFGWFDNSAGVKRLYPWGGYDPSIKDTGTRSCAGFYYQGNDGTISGCVNPADRSTTHLGHSGTVPTVKFLTAGKPRPLVNAGWLDYVIVFNPDGSVVEQTPMYSRRYSYAKRGGTTDQYSAGGTGNGDLGDYTAKPGASGTDNGPLLTYLAHTGRLSVTLAPDADADRDTFGNAQEAMNSIWPACRVTITSLGDVRVTMVSKLTPPGAVLDTTTITDWQVASQITANYVNFIATKKVNGVDVPRGMPVADFLTPDILAARQWWLK